MIYFTENIKNEIPLTYGDLIETVKYKSDKLIAREDVCSNKTTMMKMVIKLAKEKYLSAYKKHLLMGFVSEDEVILIRRRVA